jgi:anti-sigma factor RsiW
VTEHEPDADELARYLDGESSENRAAAIRAHVVGCARCRDELARQRRLITDLAAPIADANDDRVAQLMRRLATAPARPAPSGRTWWLGGGVALAACAALAVVVATRAPDTDAVIDARARGADHRDDRAATAIARHVGVAAYTSPARVRLHDGDRVAADTAYVISYRNLDRAAPLYLLAFAVDAGGAVHWLYPGFVDPAADPPAIALPVADTDAWFADSVAFDDVAPGPLRIVTIVLASRPRLSAIEQLSPDQRSRAALQARWPDAVVRETTVIVTSPNGAPR